MHDARVGPDRGCDPDKVPTDCGSVAAIPYFVSFTLIGAFILLNLVVAVILENFSALGAINPELVSAQDIADFGETPRETRPRAPAAVDPPSAPPVPRAPPAPLTTLARWRLRAVCRRGVEAL